MKTAPVLKTARLLLHGITEEDTDLIVVLRSTSEVFRFFVSSHKITKAEHIKWFQDSYLKNENRIDWVASDSGGVSVGVFGVKREDKYAKEAEVSYILLPERYGQGYASEAVNRLIEFCQIEWKCDCITAEIHEQNITSIRFAEKLGFKREEKRGRFFRYKREL